LARVGVQVGVSCLNALKFHNYFDLDSTSTSPAAK
jgi:hypothetical protein